MNLNKTAIFKTKILLFAIIVVCISCRPTRYVPEGSYLLNKSKVECSNKQINTDELEGYIKQKPNRKILLMFRFHLWIYNIANSGKERKWKAKIKEIVGEEPVIYDDFLKTKSSKQLLQYLKNKGYYKAIVTDTTIYKNKKAKVEYQIISNEVYKINNVEYQFEDDSIKQIILDNSNNSLIKTGTPLDVDLLQSERNRITNVMNNYGYYYFSKEYIYFEVDSNSLKNQADIKLSIKKNIRKIADKEFVNENHKIYKIRNIFIFSDYDPKMLLTNPNYYKEKSDTLIFNYLSFIYKNKLTIKSGIISQSTYLKPNDIYNKNTTDKTYKALSSLRIFKLINIIYSDVSNENDNLLDCYIQLTPFNMQSYTVELEGTNSSGNLGVASNLLYQHKSLFKGAEILDLKFKGALEAQTTTLKSNEGIIQEDIPFNTIEIGSESGLSFQQFLLPIKSEKFTQKYNPRTKIGLSYNFQNRPDYTRTILKNSFGYYWDGSKYLKHIVNPIEINSVRIKYNSEEFIESIKDPYVKSSYTNHLVTVTSYSLIYNTQNINKNRDFVYINWNAESSGNILTAINNFAGADTIEGSYNLLGIKYAQFVKSEIDLRYYNIFNKANSSVTRFFAGLGYPYGNLNVLPFEKKYFSGGANSIRAWQVRSLGPGSFIDSLNMSNQLGDIKLEANFEYRFKLIWVLEGAFFIDAGNIWAINNDDIRENAIFKFSDFYKQLAVGSGLGARFDFSFFVFRFDVGLKVREPQFLNSKSRITNQPWVIENVFDKDWKRAYRNSNNDNKYQFFAFNFGIGYPF